MERKRIGFYDYTVILTYGGLLSAFLGILHCLERDFWDAVLCLMLAGVCDMFDGAVASTKARSKAQKRFGIQIDSLSDLVSFGVLPSLFIYQLCGGSFAAGVTGAGYVLCALIRLAYFNVLEEERQEKTPEKEKSFLGVPVTTVAILLPAVYLLYDNAVLHSRVWFPVLNVLLAAGFLFPVEIKKPRFLGKICLILVGIVEAVALFFLASWGAT